jgi:predicted lipoprotein with Yx(FWY)xxD motif
MPQITKTALPGMAVLALLLAWPSLSAYAQNASVKVGSDKAYGKYLTDGDGKPLYLFTLDKQGMGYATPSSKCSGDCASAWPPFAPKVPPTASIDVKSELIGSLRRGDDSMQVTYNGWPLYTFVKDKPNDAPEGQDKHGFGGEWYLISPAGKKIKAHDD